MSSTLKRLSQTLLKLKDIEWIEKHYETIKKSFHGTGTANLADKAKKEEIYITGKVLVWLKDDGWDVRKGDWNNKEIDVINTLQLLTAKPKNKWLPNIKVWIDANNPGDLLIPLLVALEERVLKLGVDDKVPARKEELAKIGTTRHHFRLGYLFDETTLCDFSLLIDPQPVTKLINTYSGSIDITYAGKFNLGGTLIFPAFYAPNGPRNLVSVSQLEDHGLKVVGKNRMYLIKLGQRIIYRFPRVGNLYEGQIPKSNTTNYVMNISDPDPHLDYHILLGHPSDEYLTRFFRLYNITPVNSNQSAKKLRSFKSSMKYILVIIDDYSRFNRTYLMRKKSESEGKILSYLNEIVNKTEIRIEAGPANNPQTNGLAERFNQALLVKIRCLLAQSMVPINFWDKAARYASTLINILPSKSLNWSSPVSVLSELNSCIEPIRDIHKLIPFVPKVYVSHRPPLKISAPSKPLLCLGYEDHSDAYRFFDPLRRHVEYRMRDTSEKGEKKAYAPS
ncbi:hypothetical protein MJO28_002180 [Puccinia striiformis f. sp. tritici]|uniref:Uncharacterized protein n=1 Tax=Puccinia striiformis f. sp. tritici TaxID=168172 RepID=A0ACC0EW19_9BASI|nr:hypothetical protein MJO28_002180 [Puccinia striiformis f. sp. tritici]